MRGGKGGGLFSDQNIVPTLSGSRGVEIDSRKSCEKKTDLRLSGDKRVIEYMIGSRASAY